MATVLFKDFLIFSFDLYSQSCKYLEIEFVLIKCYCEYLKNTILIKTGKKRLFWITENLLQIAVWFYITFKRLAIQLQEEGYSMLDFDVQLDER